MTRWRRTGLPAVAVLLLGAFLWYWATLRPADSFGLSYDDTVCFVTAQTVAQGHGFTLANLPEAPPLTKFPPLAALWRLAPSFPANRTGFSPWPGCGCAA